MPKILIVEDEKNLLEAYQAKLGHDGAFDVVTAECFDDVDGLIEEGKGAAFDAIAVDGCFPYSKGGDPFPAPGRACNGEKLVLWLRGPRVRYAGPIIACSSLPEFNEKMVAAGATRAAVKGYGVIDAIMEIFRSSSTPA